MSARLVPIGDVVERTSTWNPLNEPGSEFDYIDLSAVDQDTKRILKPNRLRTSEAPSRARQLVAAGDVLVSTVRPNLNGVAKIAKCHHGMTASTGFCVLRPTPTKLHGGYLFQWVKSQEFIKDMVRKATGASYPAVSDRIIKESLIPLPPLDEQKRIAAILDKADELRAKRRHAVALLDSLTQSIFLEMFGDLTTGTIKWSSLRLRDIAEVGSGITKGRKLNSTEAIEVPYLAVANVQDKALNLTTVKTIEATPSEIRRYRLETNDLLLTEGGDPDKLGRGTLWRGELPLALHQNHIFRVRFVSSGIEPLFANWVIGSAYGKSFFLKSAKQTTGIASINKSQLSDFPMIVPPLDLQRSFVKRAESISTQMGAQVAHMVSLDRGFAALQSLAFRGEI